MTPEIVEKLSKVMTVYPQEGESRVNLNTADPLVLQALDPRITQSVASDIVQGRPFKTIQELDRVSSFEAIGKELRLQNLYDIKSDLFLTRMIVGVNEVTRNATVVLQRDQNTGRGAVLYYRVL
jgi:general secretion pathway protein K